MKTTTIRSWGAMAVVLVAVAIAGCGELSTEVDGAGGAAGALATGGSGAGGAGAPGAGGTIGAAGTTGSGGTTAGAGGAAAGLGGMTGAGGAPVVTYQFCSSLGWTVTSSTKCSKLISVGVYQTGYKDGHVCEIGAGRPSGIPDCYLGVDRSLAVVSCGECVFQ